MIENISSYLVQHVFFGVYHDKECYFPLVENVFAKGIDRGGLFSLLNCGNLNVHKLATNVVATKIELCEIGYSFIHKNVLHGAIQVMVER